MRWFHTGGIYAGLSESAPMVILEAMESAKPHGTIISYDLNYRASLWESFGGSKAAQRINKKIANHVDVMIGNEEDFSACLGFQVKGVDKDLKSLPINGFKSKTLEDSKIANEKAKMRNVGFTIETKPDYCQQKHVDMMLDYGTTRVEIGVQSLTERVYNIVNLSLIHI